ncbi:MAG: FAD binding domain-containing protein [Acidobacteria bacterium]|nr:FAD binding domain-containing protein [Acidobacteriota bacterium]
MSLPPFVLLRPPALDEALGHLSKYGPEAMVIAGGTDVVPNLRAGLFAPRALVDIKGLNDLRGIEFDAVQGLRIGALTTITEIAESPAVRKHYPVLSEAAATVASPVLRNMGTLGGNLCLETRCLWYNQSFVWRKSCGFCLKKDGTVCHVAPGGQRCWAVWSSDTAPALLTLEAELGIASPRATRWLPLDQFYKNDGMDRMRLERDELVIGVRVPARTAGVRGSYTKLRIRSSIDYPLAGVAVAMKVEDGVCRSVRMALTGVNPAPLLVREVAKLIEGKPYSADAVEEAAHAAIRTGKPLTTSVSTPEYRRDVLRVYARRSLTRLWTGNGNGRH